MTRIALIGYMGAGKTTLGRALAKDTGLPFYDLDWYIEERYHRTVSQLFAEKGEKGFRKIERNMLHEVAEFDQIVLSCGGGTPCFYDNMAYLNEQMRTVYLKATPDVLCRHLKMGKTDRPLLHGKTDEQVAAFIKESLRQREPFYLQAQHIFDITLLDTRTRIQEAACSLREIINI